MSPVLVRTEPRDVPLKWGCHDDTSLFLGGPKWTPLPYTSTRLPYGTGLSRVVPRFYGSNLRRVLTDRNSFCRFSDTTSYSEVGDDVCLCGSVGDGTVVVRTGDGEVWGFLLQVLTSVEAG